MVKHLPAHAGDEGSIPGSGPSPGGGTSNPPVFLPGESKGQRSLVGYSSWGCKETGSTLQLSMQKKIGKAGRGSGLANYS